MTYHLAMLGFIIAVLGIIIGIIVSIVIGIVKLFHKKK